MRPHLPVLALLLPAFAHASVSLAPLFSDYAVLQAGSPVAVWGRALPGERVSVTYAGQAAAAVAGRDGRWSAVLVPMQANSEGSDLTATGGNSAVAHDVVVGEVWLCSGQSNMALKMAQLLHNPAVAKRTAADIAASRLPLLREFLVKARVSAAPAEEAEGSWSPCSPQMAGGFTAVGYYFALQLQRRFGWPVGLIESDWGGTPIELWMSAAALAANPVFAAEPKALPGIAPRFVPGSLYNGMIHPLLPYSLRGVLWYQGERNANTGRSAGYHSLFASLITDWRAGFGRSDLPFLWVQLPNYKAPTDRTGTAWAVLREEQSETLSLPHTGQAVTIDIGEPANLHPGNKAEVGRRLALLAKAEVYGIAEDDSGPVFAGATREGNTLRIRFKFAGSGLTAGDGPLQSFEVAGADRIFHPAIATLSGETVVVRSSAVPEPLAVRYAWSNAPKANLYNGAGLPATPFSSEPWRDPPQVGSR